MLRTHLLLTLDHVFADLSVALDNEMQYGLVILRVVHHKIPALGAVFQQCAGKAVT